MHHAQWIPWPNLYAPIRNHLLQPLTLLHSDTRQHNHLLHKMQIVGFSIPRYTHTHNIRLSSVFSPISCFYSYIVPLTGLRTKTISARTFIDIRHTVQQGCLNFRWPRLSYCWSFHSSGILPIFSGHEWEDLIREIVLGLSQWHRTWLRLDTALA